MLMGLVFLGEEPGELVISMPDFHIDAMLSLPVNMLQWQNASVPGIWTQKVKGTGSLCPLLDAMYHIPVFYHMRKKEKYRADWLILSLMTPTSTKEVMVLSVVANPQK